MVRPDDAPTLEPLADGTGFRTRVRFGKERRRFRIPSTDEVFAAERAAVLRELGEKLGPPVPTKLAAELLTRAGAADATELAKIKATVEKLARGAKAEAKPMNARTAWTVRELGEAWTNGTLAKEFPDQIKKRRSASDDGAG